MFEFRANPGHAAATQVPACDVTVRYPEEPGLVAALRQRVDDYFAASDLPRRGDAQILSRARVLLAAGVVAYALLVFGGFGMVVTALLTVGAAIVSCALVVMGHNALHGMLGPSGWTRRLSILVLRLHGFDLRWWHHKHHRLHHLYPNVYGVDDDLEHSGLLRLSAQAPWRRWHRLQHWYAWLLYPLTYLGMVLVGDPRFRVTGKISGTGFDRGGTRDLAAWLSWKLVAATLLVALPVAVNGAAAVAAIAAWAALLGLMLAVLFVSTHTVTGTRHPRLAEDRSVSDGRLCLAIAGAADVGLDNPVIDRLFAGVTAHTAHHVFPRVSATHYRAIAAIIREFSIEHRIPYTAFDGFLDALRAHREFLKDLGSPPPEMSRRACPA